MNRNLELSTGKSVQVREMFSNIAPRYDFLNHVLSGNIDRLWRRFTVRKLRDVLESPGAVALDIACGTGDLSLELGRYVRTIGCDFCHPMLTHGLEKTRASNRPVWLSEGDALNLPFADDRFNAVTIAFGLRNLDSVVGGLKEIFRVLKPDGRAAILEFSQPVLPVFRQMFGFYFTKILPRIGKAISGNDFAYQYLPDSVRSFPDQRTLASMMQQAGFDKVRYFNLSGGIAALHIGEKTA
ncbi:MAG TPA: bifunctional demethylmenaquinone methyltransferase/2-methoxy-6-polyprenyl-1,4-benzoquinol methylase UbiE [Blastocatellia bacterium]|nr:bifunctional demethylmenaquinone methyltransferase/2-methoxy-6-polyprenyl-1,4-benzoquinol methylase UbiE [Blastocatellia bacterium]